MTNTAHKNDFTPRKNLNRTVQYRPLIARAHLFVMGFVTIYILAVPIVQSIQSFSSGDRQTGLTKLAFGLVIGAITWAVARFYLRPLSQVQYMVDSMGLKIVTSKAITQIPFSEVKSVEFSKVNTTEGWFKIHCTSGAVHKVSVLLERSEYILEAMAAFDSKLIGESDMLNYRHIAVVSDHSWFRLYSRVKSWNLLISQLIVVPIVAAVFNQFIQTKMLVSFNDTLWTRLVVFFQINLFTSFCIWILSNNVFSHLVNKRLLKEPNNLGFDKQLDTIVHTVSLFVYGALILSIAFVLNF